MEAPTFQHRSWTGGHIYLANRNGVVRCYEFETGRRTFEERMGAGVAFSSSLVAADGKIYCPAEEGVVHVIKAGPVVGSPGAESDG